MGKVFSKMHIKKALGRCHSEETKQKMRLARLKYYSFKGENK